MDERIRQAEIDFPVGSEAWYHGTWGTQPAVLVTIMGHGQNKGRVVMDADNGHWGYIDQFSKTR